MAFSFNRYTADGSTVDYTLSFPYLDKNHIIVTVQGAVVTNWEWLTTASIRFDEAPLLNEIIVIARCTPKEDRLVDFQAGSLLDPNTLNLDSKQLLYVMQEVLDGVTNFNENGTPMVVYDREAMLSALTGYITSSQLTSDLSSTINYAETLAKWKAIYEDDIYEEETPTLYQPYYEAMDEQISEAATELTVQDGRILANVATLESHDGRLSTNEGQLSLMADEFFVKLDSNGNVAGFGLLNGETSQFTVNVDKFAVIKADGTGDIKKPFIIDTDSGTVGIDGNLVVTGSISSDKIVAGTITGDKIASSTITASNITTTSLSSLSANLGTVTAGMIRSTNYSSGSAGTEFDLSNGDLEINSASGLQVLGAGYIYLKPTDGTGGMRFVWPSSTYLDLTMKNSNTALCFQPSTSSAVNLWMGFNPNTGTKVPFYQFGAYASNIAVLDCASGSISNNVYITTTSLRLSATDGTNSARMDFYPTTNTTTVSSLYFRPAANDAYYLGGGSYRWKEIHGTTIKGQDIILDNLGSIYPAAAGYTSYCGKSGNYWGYGYFNNLYYKSLSSFDVMDDLKVIESLGAKSRAASDGHSPLRPEIGKFPEFLTNKAEVREQIKKENGDLITDEEINEILEDPEDMEDRIFMHAGNHTALLEGGIRQLYGMVKEALLTIKEQGVLIQELRAEIEALKVAPIVLR